MKIINRKLVSTKQLWEVAARCLSHVEPEIIPDAQFIIYAAITSSASFRNQLERMLDNRLDFKIEVVPAQEPPYSEMDGVYQITLQVPDEPSPVIINSGVYKS